MSPFFLKEDQQDSDEYTDAPNVEEAAYSLQLGGISIASDQRVTTPKLATVETPRPKNQLMLLKFQIATFAARSYLGLIPIMTWLQMWLFGT